MKLLMVTDGDYEFGSHENKQKLQWQICALFALHATFIRYAISLVVICRTIYLKIETSILERERNPQLFRCARKSIRF